MEKIVLIINANKPNTGSIDFACKMAEFAQTRLTGLFVENLYFDYTPAGDATGASFISQAQEKTGVRTDTDQAIRVFKEECQRRGIGCEVYVDKGEPLQEVIFESRFADLLIVDPYINFYDREETAPSHFIRELLKNAECPVCIAPEKFEDIDEIVFCYDGSASALFAIKFFTYLFPAFNKKKVILLEIKHSGKDEFDESHRRTMYWLRCHYDTVSYYTLKGNVKDELFTWFFMKTRKLIVMGAYGRSMLSRLFKKSSADTLIRMVDLPLFITHH